MTTSIFDREPESIQNFNLSVSIKTVKISFILLRVQMLFIITAYIII